MTQNDYPDALGAILGQLRLHATIGHLGRFCGNWALDTSGGGRATFHLVLSGVCWLHLGERRSPLELGAGDLVLFPSDAKHLISHGPERSAPTATLPLPSGSEPALGGAVLVCGQVLFEPGLAGPLLEALPAHVLFQSATQGEHSWPHLLARRALDEAVAASAGSSIVIERVVDLLFIEAIRQHLALVPEQHGLLAALSDARLARALGRMHGELDAPWTLEMLAEVAGMSRSAFVDAFRSTLGETPMKYLARHRLHVAGAWLRETNNTVLDVALRAGYRTEAAFVRAFKRELGTTPGATRARRGVSLRPNASEASPSWSERS